MFLGLRFSPVVLNQEASLNFQGVTSPYAPCNMESLINKFNNKNICFSILFKVRGVWNKGQLLS